MVTIDFCNIQCLKKGSIRIKKNAINVKYSYNGFGKSSLAKAIYYGIEDIDSLDTLSPFGGGAPAINNLETFKSCKMFNEDFVEDTLFQSDNLVEESYNVFIGNSRLKEKEKGIDIFLADLNSSLNNALLEKFVIDSNDVMKNLVLNKNGDDLDRRKPGYKGLSKAPNIASAALLTSAKDFERIINAGYLTEWLDWHKRGHSFILNMQCPFCNNALTPKQSNYNFDIDTLIDGMDFKNNKSVREIITNKVIPYAGQNNATEIEELLNDPAFKKSKKEVLISILKKIGDEVSKIEELKNIRDELDDKQTLIETLLNCKLNEDFFGNINKNYKQIASDVNKNIDSFIKSIEGILNEAKTYNEILKDAVESSNAEINTFLKTAGIPYEFNLDLISRDQATTKLTPLDNKKYKLDDITSHLSYGERNAISVALFGAVARSSNADLIILDDPISSFDENKKFAIMNFLFNSTSGVLKDKTVILFTHDFEPIIETKNNIVEFGRKERFVTVLSKSNGIVSELAVSNRDIKNAYVVEEEYARDESLDDFIRLIHLRKFYELKNGRLGDAYDIMSSAVHLRIKPSDKGDHEYDNSVVINGVNYIQSYIANFSYNNFVTKHSLEWLVNLYHNETNNYNKLVILRAIDELADLETKTENPILYNFLSFNFHVESLYLYQIKCIDTIPSYIIELCDSIVSAIESEILN